VSSIFDLPKEIYEFLSKPIPQSLLVRGPPGAGKTTFALSLLENYKGPRFYLSSRVLRQELTNEFPWITNGSGIRVVDAADRRDNLREAARLQVQAQRMVQDADRDPTTEALWLPSPIQEVWSQTSPDVPGIMVIDSWDALVERYLGTNASALPSAPDRTELERMVLDLISRGALFLVLVLEQDAESQLDYLVNAVVHLGWEDHDGRPERWMHLLKLRGTRIDNAAYPYTLEGGRFQCISPISIQLDTRLRSPEPDAHRDEPGLWPGSAEFAHAFGRLPIGGMSIIEKDLQVSATAPRLLIMPMVAEVLHGGGRVTYILPPNTPAEEIFANLEPFLSPEQIAHQVRIQTTTVPRNVPEKLAGAVLPPPTPGEVNGTGSRTPEAINFVRTPAGGKGNLSVVWTSALRAMNTTNATHYTPENLPSIVLQYTSGAPVHVVFISPMGDPLIDHLKAITALHLQMKSRVGRVFVHGEQPVTPQFVLSDGDHRVAYRLVRIV
jgi:GvpD gas vesicle protein